MCDGSLRRFTHDWNDSLQTTAKPLNSFESRKADETKVYNSGSYYFYGTWMDFSGSLDPSIRKSELEDTGKTREGACWFFHHNHVEAHNAVHTTVPCRVYRQKSYEVTCGFADDTSKNFVVERGLPKEAARELCSNPESSSRTATSADAQKRTEDHGPWFYRFTEE